MLGWSRPENNRYRRLLRSILIVTGLISTLYFFFSFFDRKTEPSRWILEMVEGGRSGKETRKKDGIMMLILNRVRELWRSILATSVTSRSSSRSHRNRVDALVWSDGAFLLVKTPRAWSKQPFDQFIHRERNKITSLPILLFLLFIVKW